MSTIRILSCYLARISLSQTHRTIIGYVPSGVISLNKHFSSAPNCLTLTCPISCKLRFLAAKPSTSVYDLTKYSSNSFSTNAPGLPDDRKSDSQSEQNTSKTDVNDLIFGDSSNLSLFARFKLMYKKYWYVLIPVYITTSVGWFFGFYYLSKRYSLKSSAGGVDISAILQYMHLSETIIEKAKHSDMGHYAVAFLCYKIVTPIRYAVILGLTTVSIKRLVYAGYIKPMPTKKEFIQMYEKKKIDRAKRKEDEEKIR